MILWYTLDENKEPVPSKAPYPKSPENKADWVIGNTTVGERRVSTVFLSFDHNSEDGPPLLFETMVFPVDSYDEEYCRHYATRSEAIAGHNATVALLMEGKLNATCNYQRYSQPAQEDHPPRG